MAQQFIERRSIEYQIDVALCKGKRVGNEIICTPESDPLNIFKKRPGTSSYFRSYRGGIFAMMEQLGPFHFFFTLSCAEKWWLEVILSLLRLVGHCITFLESKENDKEEIFVDDEPLDDFLESHKDEMSDLYKDKFVYVTRLFNDRLLAFRKNFLDKEFAHYTYRIEFQARGNTSICCYLQKTITNVLIIFRDSPCPWLSLASI